MQTRRCRTISVMTTAVSMSWIMTPIQEKCARDAPPKAIRRSPGHADKLALWIYSGIQIYLSLERYLDQAEHVERFIFDKNMPEDLVPYWDFDDRYSKYL